MGVVVNSPAVLDLVDENPEIEQIASGCMFTEGPVWNHREGYLLFSDMPGDKRRKWSRAGGVEVVRDPSNKCNGMTYDADGNLLVCEHWTSTVVRERPDGTRETLASHWQGKELNSPNDIVYGPNGHVYFSDPHWGRLEGFGNPRERELDFCGVYRIDPAGELHLATDDLPSPNGLCFSPDGRLLYVNDTLAAHIKVFDVNADGSLSNRRMFAEGIGTGDFETGLADGMKCDERGNVWVTGPKGIWILSPAGEHLGVLEIPEHTGNLAWGGDDWRTLFVPASTSVYAVRTKVAANLEPFMKR